MIFSYKAVLNTGEQKQGTIEAMNIDVAIDTLQKKGLILSAISPIDEKKNILNIDISFFNKVSTKDIVILSRQLATLFDAQVSALRIFSLIGDQVENKTLRKHLIQVADDLKAGSSISNALSKHSDVFSDFYVNMVKAGEESGKLDQTFNYLADYLDRNFDVTSKARNALIYPAFVIVTFLAVMIVMFTVVIPKITSILGSTGTVIPIYTQIVIDISSFLVNYGIYLLVALAIGGFFLVRYVRTPTG